MGKLAFLFPGQGSQKVGMGSELRDARPELFDRYFAQADAVSGLSVAEYTREGPMESLTSTDVAQPALFSLSLAVFDAARELGLKADYVAGHSLGEYTAAVASGALAPEDGMRLVCERGRLMAGIQDERPGAMAAILGLEAERVAELSAQAASDGGGIVAPANINSPTQIVVSGEEAAVERLMGLASEAGAARAVRLPVGAAFHSELMKPVQEKLGAMMADVAWRDPDVPLISNASGARVDSADGVREALIAQIASPVLWVDCVRTLQSEGVTSVLELGPGRVLTGLVRQIAPGEIELATADSPAKLEQFAAAG